MPVIKGTRVPVSVILGQIAEGESWDTLLAGYPELKKKEKIILSYFHQNEQNGFIQFNFSQRT